MFGKSKTDKVFFDNFTAHASLIVQAADMLHVMLGDLPANEKIVTIRELEHKADDIVHSTMNHLHATWITPIDRADIHSLISKMDDVMDHIESAGNRLVQYEINELRPDVISLSDELGSACVDLLAAVESLPELKKKSKLILEKCKAIHQRENNMDLLHREAISNLFKNEKDPILVMKWRDVYDRLEKAADSCLDVADILEGIMLEYA